MKSALKECTSILLLILLFIQDIGSFCSSRLSLHGSTRSLKLSNSLHSLKPPTGQSSSTQLTPSETTTDRQRKRLERQRIKIEKTRESVVHFRLINKIPPHKMISIATNFTVPNTSHWPAHLRGFKLGSSLHGLRYNPKSSHLRGILSELGIKGAGREQRFETFLTALAVYRDLYGDLAVPRDFEVPKSDAWPRETWGMRLGVVTSSTRQRKCYRTEDKFRRLNNLGFVWNPLQLSHNYTIDALKAFKATFGHVNVSSSYVVPSSPKFPSSTWGLKLGNRVANLRYRGGDEELREAMKELGVPFEYEVFDSRHWEFIYSALKLYKTTRGHLRVPPRFVVPKEVPWPPNLWGLKLGYRVSNIRYRGDFVSDDPNCRKLLNDLGFVWKKGDPSDV